MTLAHSRYADLFENGYDQLLKNGYWRLKHVSREAIEQLSANVSSSGRGSPHGVLTGSGSSLTASGSHPNTAGLSSPAGTPHGTPLHHLNAHHHHPSHHHHMASGTGSPLNSHPHAAHLIASGFTSAAASPSSMVASPAHILKYAGGSVPMGLAAALGLAGSVPMGSVNGLSATATTSGRSGAHGEEQMSILASLAMAEGAEELNTVNSLTALSASSQSIGTSSTSRTHMSVADDMEEYSLQHAAERRRAMSAQFRSSPSAAADIHAPVGDGSAHQMRKEYQALENKFKALESDHRTALLHIEKYHSLLLASMRQDETSRITFARQSEIQEGQVRHLVEKVQLLERELNQRPASQSSNLLGTMGSPPKPATGNTGASGASNSILNLSNSSISSSAGIASPSGTATPTPLTPASILQSALAAGIVSGSANGMPGLTSASPSSAAAHNAMMNASNMQSIMQANAAAQASLAAAMSGSGAHGVPGNGAAGAHGLSFSHPMNAAAAAALLGVTANMPKMGATPPAGFSAAAAAALYQRNLPWLATANGMNALNPLGWVGISSADQVSALASLASQANAKLDLSSLQHIAAVTQNSALAAAANVSVSTPISPAPTPASVASPVPSKAASPVNTNLTIPAPIVAPAVPVPGPMESKHELTSSGGAPSPTSSTVSTAVTTPNSVKAEIADNAANSGPSSNSSSTNSAVTPQPLVA